MGFDLMGKNGNRFRASIWSWRAILQLVEETCVLTPEVVDSLRFNDGQRVDGDEARRLGFAINEIVGSRPDSYVYEVIKPMPDQCGTSAIGERILECLEVVGLERPRSGSLYCATAEHVRAFSRFCRDSGGFNVW